MSEKIVAKLHETKEKLHELLKVDGFGTHRGTQTKSAVERIISIANRVLGNPNDYSSRLHAMINNSWGFNGDDSDIHKVVGVLDTLIDDIELREEKQRVIEEPTRQEEQASLKKEVAHSLSTKVFVVHGHNDAMKESVARAIEKLGLKAVILHEQSNRGDTVIEKLTRHSDVGFAVVLLSADDLGYAKRDGNQNARPRARQNVILELGYFTGLLGRKKVVALFEDAEDFEIPSDYNGVVYVPYRSKENDWKFRLVQELRDAGFRVDANNLL